MFVPGHQLNPVAPGRVEVKPPSQLERLDSLTEGLTRLLEDSVRSQQMTPATAARVIQVVQETSARLRQVASVEDEEVLGVADVLRSIVNNPTSHKGVPNEHYKAGLRKEIARQSAALGGLLSLAEEWNMPAVEVDDELATQAVAWDRVLARAVKAR